MNATEYRSAVQEAVHPDGVGQAVEFMSAMSIEFSILLLLPFLVFLVYGALIGEWENENYWLLFFAHLIVVIGSAVMLPYILMAV